MSFPVCIEIKILYLMYTNDQSSSVSLPPQIHLLLTTLPSTQHEVCPTSCLHFIQALFGDIQQWCCSAGLQILVAATLLPHCSCSIALRMSTSTTGSEQQPHCSDQYHPMWLVFKMSHKKKNSIYWWWAETHQCLRYVGWQNYHFPGQKLH